MAQQYALLQKAEPVVISITDDEISSSGTTTAGHAATNDQCQSPTLSLATQLLNLYEVYSEAYPNPALQEENQERDRLLHAISAANHAVQVNPKKVVPKTKSRWWNLFGNSSSSMINDNISTPTSIEEENDDDRLVYTDIIHKDDVDRYEYDRDFLLGTGFSIDPMCIPDEVHSLARHYLCMNRKTDGNNKQHASPKVARTSWETAGTCCIVIAGLGRLVEFRNNRTKDHSNKSVSNNNSNDTSYTSAGMEVYTSDRQNLLDRYSLREQQQQQCSGRHALSMTPWHHSQANASLVGPNFLIIHWGLDSTVTFYRRVAISSDVVILDDSQYVVTWEAVAICGVTAQVREALADEFSDTDDDTELMNVTAIHPLVVEIPQHAPIVTVAVARLGGFIELVPLPPQMWYGAEIPFTKKHVQTVHNTNRATKRKKGIGLKGGHSTAAYNLPDLATSSNIGGGIVILNTGDYHSDVLGLESFPITHKLNEVWNRELYSDGPPAEYVLAAYGAKAQTERQIISFWSFSAKVFPSAPNGVGFSIYSCVVEAIDLGKVGPDITLFASPTIYRHWRKPRHVKLRDPHSVSPTDTWESKNQRTTTLSLSVPIVQLSFALLGDNAKEIGPGCTVCAAVLDWNGGVTLLDCSLLAQTAAHTLSEVEYTRLFGMVHQDEVRPFVNIMASRTKISQSIAQCRQADPTVCISSINCFQKPTKEAGSSLMLAAMTNNTLFFIYSTFNNSRGDSLLFKTTALQCPRSGRGQFLLSSKRDFVMNLIFQVHLNMEARQSDCIAVNFCVVQEQKPYDIIKSLMNSKKFMEAIVAAEKVPQYELVNVASVLEDCKKELWKTGYDISVLESIRDDEYIMNVAFLHPMKNDERTFLNDEIGLYRSVCRLALKRIQTARLGLSLSFAENVIEIKSRLIKLGTYDLLCENKAVRPSLIHFFEDFMLIPMIDFAMSCAMRADLATLSIFWFRHQHELYQHHFRILNAIPVSVSPALYQHILPVAKEDDMDEQSQGLFIAGFDKENICSYSDIPDFLNNHYQLSVIIDEEDASLVLDHGLGSITAAVSNGEQYSINKLADWYIYRAHAIEKFAANVVSVTTFARLGLVALRIPSSDTTDQAAIPALSVQSLHQLIHFSELLRNIPSYDKDLTNLGLKTFEEMDTIDIVTLTIKCGGESVDYLARYNDYLLPLMMQKLDGCGVTEINTAIDEAIQKFCMNLFRDVTTQDIGSFLGKVTVCSNIFHSCRTTLPVSARIVKQIDVLIHLAPSLVKEIARISCSLTLRPEDQQCIIERLWKIYESLPVILPNRDSNDDLMTTLETLHRNLTFLDIVSSWPNRDGFMMMLNFAKFDTQSNNNNSLDTIKILSEGEHTISLLCHLFCSQVESSRDDEMLNRKATVLLSALINDCNELNKICFKGQLQLNSLLIKHLAKRLIEQRDLVLLGEYLSQSVHNTAETRTLSNEVLLSFNATVYGTSVGTDRKSKTKTAIEFQDVLGKWLPELSDQFDSLRQFLDAAQFISTTLLPGSIEILKPEQIQSMKALNVIDFVLRKNPKVVVLNQSDWEDPKWCRHANEAIRQNGNLTRDEPASAAVIQSTVPKLPGEAIFHLAQLLGLSDMQSVVAVKSLTVGYALISKLDGAAAAICRSLMVDSLTSNVGISLVLADVAKIVSREDYDDYSTKQELCTSVLLHISTSLQGQTLASFEIILESWNRLQYRNVLNDHGNDFPSGSFRRFYDDSRRIYGVSIADLVDTLCYQVTASVINDEAIVALARHAALWCLDRLTEAKIELNPQFRSQSINVIFDFAAALVLHVRDCYLFHEYLHELKEIFVERHNDSSIPKATESSLLHPKAEIVAGLIGRGYTENGARRSTASVNNLGFSEALQWAVTHSLDAGFDDPIVILRPTDQDNIDIESADAFQRFVTNVEMYFEGSTRLAPSIEIVGTIFEQQEAKSAIATNAPVEISTNVGTESASVVNVDHIQFKKAQQLPEVLETIESEQLSQSGFVQEHSNGVTSFPIEKKAALPSSRLPMENGGRNIPSNVNQTSLQIPPFVKKSSPNSAPVVLPFRERTGVSIAIPKSNESSPDRSALFQVGQEAFLNAQQRRPTSSPSRAERLRLIEEGRRLLNQARTTFKAVSDQNNFPVQSSTPTSMLTNPVTIPMMLPPSQVTNGSSPIRELKNANNEPPDNVNETSNDPDEWDFDDENFDL